jgi:Concanavalin A-like lectin/glucanases superfamily
MIDPCGMVVDYLRSCSTRPFWVHAPTGVITPHPPDSGMGYGTPADAGPSAGREWVQIRWYWAPEGALPLPFDTIYASSDWLSQLESPQMEYGEIPRATKTHVAGPYIDGTPEPVWNDGSPPLGATGKTYCGLPEWYQGPVPPGSLVRPLGGVPACCNPAVCAAIAITNAPVGAVGQVALPSPPLTTGAIIGSSIAAPAGAAALRALTQSLGAIAAASASAPVGSAGLAAPPVPAAPLGLAQPQQLYLTFSSAQAVTCANEAFLPTGNSPFTVITGIFPPPTNQSSILVNFGNSAVPGQQAYWTIQTSNELLAGNGTVNLFSSGGILSSAWTRAGMVFDGANLSIWISGVLNAGPTPFVFTTTLIGSGIQIGWWNSFPAFYDGQLQDVRIYSYALSPAEMAVATSCSVYTAVGSPAYWWRCNEEAGATLIDYSGNGADALFGVGPLAPTWTP